MQVFVGLGNPGSRYRSTRHNFGWWVLESFANRLGVAFKPGKGDYLFARDVQRQILLIKPTMFMNDSGIPVKAALKWFGLPGENMMIIHDDIDLPLGTIRFRPRGTAAGHRGMESVIYHLVSDEFPRLRLGIATDARMRPSERYVLKPFRRKDSAAVEAVVERATEGLEYYLSHGMDSTMNQFNRDQSTPA